MQNANSHVITNNHYVVGSNMNQFIQHINMQGEAITDYIQLHEWSVKHSQKFWLNVWKFCDVIGYRGECIVGEKVPSNRGFNPIIDTVWFPDTQLNYAENILSYAYQEPNAIALYFNNEQGHNETLTWTSLIDQVSIIQQWLQKNNIGKADIVVSSLPSCIENVIALLACASLGVIWYPIPPDDVFTSSTESFLKQQQPKALFCSNGYYTDGQCVDLRKANQHLTNSVTSILSVCQIEHITYSSPQTEFNDHYVDWEEILANHLPQRLKYERVWFNSPLFITRNEHGDTCSHCVGGTLLNHLKEQQIQLETNSNTICYCSSSPSDTRWLWHLSLMANGASLSLFEGDPMYSGMDSFYSFLNSSNTTLSMLDDRFFTRLETYNNECSTYTDKLTTLDTVLLSCHSVSLPALSHIERCIKSNLKRIITSPDVTISGSMCFFYPIDENNEHIIRYDALGLDIQPIALQNKQQLFCQNSFPNQPREFQELTHSFDIDKQEWLNIFNIVHGWKAETGKVNVIPS